MTFDFLLAAVLTVAPAAYAWWTGRQLIRALDDPALPEMLLARMRRIGQVTAFAVVTMLFVDAPIAIALPLMLLALLAVRYPLRRAVYEETWGFGSFIRYFFFSFLGSSLWLFAVVAPQTIVTLVQRWMPGSSPARFQLAGALGVLAAAIFLAWHRRHSTVWLAMNQGSPLAESATPGHAALVSRFGAVLDASGERLRRRPTIHRYGAAGGHFANAVALVSDHEPGVAMGDTLLSALDADEATAIFAHEVAHHELFDERSPKTRQRAALLIALLIVVVPMVELAVGGQLGLAIGLLSVIGMLVVLARRRVSLQAHETHCDLRAVELTGDADAVIRALTKIHVLSRMPRRWAYEMERAATHPSLARRIQAIRGVADVPSATLGVAVVARSTTPGAFVALDEARAHWFEGVPDDTALDIASLRERSGSYRAVAYRDLSSLRIVPVERGYAMQATDLAGTSWSTAIGAGDVAALQSALDVVDTRFGRRAVQPVMKRRAAAHAVAVVLVAGATMAGVLGFLAIPALISLVAPSVVSMASMAAMAIGWSIVSVLRGSVDQPLEIAALVATTLAGAGAAWLAYTWHRARADAPTERARRGALLTIGLLVASAVVLALSITSIGNETPRDLLDHPRAMSLAMVLLGAGAALLAMRRPAWRLAGAGTLGLALVGTTVILAGGRLWPRPSDVTWSGGELALVGTIPVTGNVTDVQLSPRGTRLLVRRITGYDPTEVGPSARFTTAAIPARGAPRTIDAIDAALVSETEMLILTHPDGDSLELRLEKLASDTGTAPVAWRLRIPALLQPHLTVRAAARRWQVAGRREVEGVQRWHSVSGSLDGGDLALADVPLDTLRGTPVFSFADGSVLLNSISVGAMRGGSSMLSMLALTLGENAIAWSLWRYDRDGRHLIGSLRGAPRCSAGMEDDVALCVDASERGTHVWSLRRTGTPTTLATFPGRFDRADLGADGRVVASSFRDRSLVVVDLATKRGVRASLPLGEYEYAMSVSSSSGGLAALLRGSAGARVALYRLTSANGSLAMTH